MSEEELESVSVLLKLAPTVQKFLSLMRTIVGGVIIFATWSAGLTFSQTQSNKDISLLRTENANIRSENKELEARIRVLEQFDSAMEQVIKRIDDNMTDIKKAIESKK